MTTFEALLRSLLTRRISPREAMRGLGEWADVDFDSNPAFVNYRESCPSQIALTPGPVRDALEATLRGALSPGELRDWALFIAFERCFQYSRATSGR
jgi:hypothetical protein